MTDWIRPWYPAGVDAHASKAIARQAVHGHLYPDCEELLRVEIDPREGSGWLDPRSPGVCELCVYRYDPDLCAEIFGDDADEKDAAA